MDASPGRPRCDERTESRRQQILAAAEQCFLDHGFHSASMHRIARTAGMSVGHIYHYFDNKEAIIAAIVAADEAITQCRFDSFRREPDIFAAMVDKADGGLARSLDTGRGALLAEILSESLRNEGIAAIVHDSERHLMTGLEDLMARIRPDAPDSDETRRHRSAQAAMVAAVFDGLRVRALRNPELDSGALLALLRPVLRCILSTPSGGSPKIESP